MKKLILFESLLILFFVLAWSVSKADEFKTLCKDIKEQTEYISWYFNELSKERFNDFSENSNNYKKFKYYDEVIAFDDSEISETLENLLIKIERRINIYDKLCR